MPERGDLYALLRVSRTATRDELKWAYERELNQAQRAGALKHAEHLVRAFEILADPHRRFVYDRHGIVPLERVPAVNGTPVPWRTPPAAVSTRRGAGVTTTASPFHARWPFVLLAGMVLGAVLVALIAGRSGMH